MKIHMQLFLIFAFYTLQASEFPLLQPISVEKAPLIQQAVPKKQETPIKKVVQKAPQKKPHNTKADTTILKIEFQSSTTIFKENAMQALEEFATYLLTNKAYQVVIYGYTDSSGDKEKNLLLSQQRANTVIDALERLGVSSTRLTAIGMGQKNPIADNAAPEGRAKNRRIEALIIE